jgi:hypothetical protein
MRSTALWVIAALLIIGAIAWNSCPPPEQPPAAVRGTIRYYTDHDNTGYRTRPIED